MSLADRLTTVTAKEVMPWHLRYIVQVQPEHPTDQGPYQQPLPTYCGILTGYRRHRAARLGIYEDWVDLHLDQGGQQPFIVAVTAETPVQVLDAAVDYPSIHDMGMVHPMTADEAADRLGMP